MLDFELTYRAYAPTLYRIGILYFRDSQSAEDVVHDSFVKLFEKQPDGFSESHLKAWLITVARNICRNKAKRERRIVPLDDNLPAAANGHSEVLSEVMRLPNLDRIAVYLHYYEGYASKEIAKMLKTSDGAVRARLKRARASLRLSLENMEDYHG